MPKDRYTEGQILRTAIGLTCLVVAFVFIALNGIILFRGASKFAHDPVEQWIYGVAAALVPLVIAVMPALQQNSFWRPSAGPMAGVPFPTGGTVAVVVVWVVFIAYNLINGAGAVGLQRADVMAERETAATQVQQDRAEHARLSASLSTIGTSRAYAQISAEMAAITLRPAYGLSGQCAKPSTRYQRDICADYLKLSGEQEAAARRRELEDRRSAIEQRQGAVGISAPTGDPQVAMLHDVTGIDEASITRWLPAMTPIMLEIGAATMLAFAMSLLGLRIDNPTVATPSSRPVNGRLVEASALISPRTPTPPSVSANRLTAQRVMAEWFFRTCVRHESSGSMRASEWFEIYAEVCRRSGDQPLPLMTFVRLAVRYVPTVAVVDGEHVFYGALPYLHEEDTSLGGVG